MGSGTRLKRQRQSTLVQRWKMFMVSIAGHGGHIWQTTDEFLFGIGCAELWEERKVSNGLIGIGALAVVVTYLGIGQPVNALGAVRIVVCEDVVGESSPLMKVDAGRAELDVVMG